MGEQKDFGWKGQKLISHVFQSQSKIMTKESTDERQSIFPKKGESWWWNWRLDL